MIWSTKIVIAQLKSVLDSYEKVQILKAGRPAGEMSGLGTKHHL